MNTPRNFAILRTLFIVGFAIQAIWNFVPDTTLVGVTLNYWLNLDEPWRPVSFVDLIHACFGFGLLGWGWGMLNSLVFVAPYVFIVMAIIYPRRWVFITGALSVGFEFLLGVLFHNPEIQVPLLHILFAGMGGAMILAGFWIKPPAGGLAAEPGAKAPGHFSQAGVFGLSAIVLTALVAFLSVNTASPTAQTELSEANFFQKFDSNQIAKAIITRPLLHGSAATITGKFFETDTNGNIVKQNGQPVEKSFIAPTVMLTPETETNLLASKNISIGKSPYAPDANIHKPFATVTAIANLLVYILLPTVLSVMIVIIFLVLLIYSLVRKT